MPKTKRKSVRTTRKPVVVAQARLLSDRELASVVGGQSVNNTPVIIQVSDLIYAI